VVNHLKTEQLVQIAAEALGNARRLFDDAVFLHDAGREASAFMVAGLAADELGKHLLVASFGYARRRDPEEWRTFKRRFRQHTAKLGNALMSAWIGDNSGTGAIPNPDAFHEERLAATYVDVAKDGAVTTPVALVTSARVDEVLATLRGEIEYCESLPWADTTRLQQLFDDGPPKGVLDVVEAMVASRDVVSLLEMAIAGRQAVSAAIDAAKGHVTPQSAESPPNVQNCSGRPT
jgi:AbiV family abortive infection protein